MEKEQMKDRWEWEKEKEKERKKEKKAKILEQFFGTIANVLSPFRGFVGHYLFCLVLWGCTVVLKPYFPLRQQYHKYGLWYKKYLKKKQKITAVTLLETLELSENASKDSRRVQVTIFLSEL